MKKKLAAIMSASLMLTACVNSGNTAADTTNAEISALANTPSETLAEEISLSDTQTETTPATPSETVTENSEAEPRSPIPPDFDLGNYAGEFDDAEPLQYYIYDSIYSYEYNKDPSAEKAALDAVMSSEYVKAVTEEAKDMLAYKDGVYSCPEDEKGFLTDTYIEFMGENYTVVPRLLMTRNAKFDGKNTEYLFLYVIPLHYDFLEWSGTSEFYIPVYVNSRGEAFILEYGAQQTLDTPELLCYYSDQAIHATFRWGHTSGTTGSAIYSFSDGKPKLETVGAGLYYDSEGRWLFNDVSGFFGHGSLFFRDGKRGCYCGVKGAPVSDELERIVRANYDIPDTDPLGGIFGGLYITLPMDSLTFEDGSFCDSGYGSIFEDKEYTDYQYWLNVDFDPSDD